MIPNLDNCQSSIFPEGARTQDFQRGGRHVTNSLLLVRTLHKYDYQGGTFDVVMSLCWTNVIVDSCNIYPFSYARYKFGLLYFLFIVLSKFCLLKTIGAFFYFLLLILTGIFFVSII